MPVNIAPSLAFEIQGQNCPLRDPEWGNESRPRSSARTECDPGERTPRRSGANGRGLHPHRRPRRGCPRHRLRPE
jgi:hypothetical protein